MATTGNRIRELRKENGMRLADLAKILDALESSISMYENGQRVPPIEVCQAIANRFNVSLDWLLCRSDLRNPEMQLATLNYPDDVHRLAKALSDLPAGVRRDVIEYADGAISDLSQAHDRVVERLKKKVEERGRSEWEARKKIRIVD